MNDQNDKQASSRAPQWSRLAKDDPWGAQSCETAALLRWLCHESDRKRRPLKSFEPGFYFDGRTVFVNQAEFFAAYCLKDCVIMRGLFWLAVEEMFHDVPINRLLEFSLREQQRSFVDFSRH
ncbi:MAG TPA: hypothetical protein VKZ53_27815 [Candidatus Angelobacter sp.]|nr:hypothetical protein [Candidatus Angelobacter sp.]